MRFWPRSRLGRPKQLLAFGEERTLLQGAAARLAGLVPPDNLLVVTNRACHEEVRRQLPQLGNDGVLVEPAARNTGPAVALAALHISARCGRRDAVMLVIPSDHLVGDEDEFRLTMAAAAAASRHGALLTVGIQPTRAETGYGYILPGAVLFEVGDLQVMGVRRFVEKPDRRRAAGYLRDGRYLWNAGMFAWQTGAILAALERRDAAAGQALAELARAGTRECAAELYCQLPALSVDNWVLERSQNVAVIPAAFEWDDVGSWAALHRTQPADNSGNVIRGTAVAVDTTGCIIEAGSRVVVTLGVRDLIIVDTGDALLVCDRRRDQDVKRLSDQLRRAGLEHLL